MMLAALTTHIIPTRVSVSRGTRGASRARVPATVARASTREVADSRAIDAPRDRAARFVAAGAFAVAVVRPRPSHVFSLHPRRTPRRPTRPARPDRPFSPPGWITTTGRPRRTAS